MNAEGVKLTTYFGERHAQQQPEREGAAQVHDEGAERKAAGDPPADGPVEQEAADRTHAAERSHREQDPDAHAVSRVRRTRLVATNTPANPAMTLMIA